MCLFTQQYFISFDVFIDHPVSNRFPTPLNRFLGDDIVFISTALYIYITLDFPREGDADNSMSDLSGICLQLRASIFGKTFGTNFKRLGEKPTTNISKSW